MRSAGPADLAISIGELSRRTGVNIETIRYYERVGILPAPPRAASGRRIYGAADTRILLFVRRARELGYTLDQIRTLLALAANDASGKCAEVREIAAGHLAEIRMKIADLRAMEALLAETVAQCDAGALPTCPVIETLSAAGQTVDKPAI
ncbi:MAG: helix-turn-helix domain-containing protein [Alphaproteobacteria bacterium]